MVNPVLRQIAEQQLDGISNPMIRDLDRQLNGEVIGRNVILKQRFRELDDFFRSDAEIERHKEARPEWSY